MNMNKALQHLYKAISGNDTSKVNISKLLVDIHYAATGVECAVKNNWSKIIDSIATNWTGGGGSSDFSMAEVTVSTAEGISDMIYASMALEQGGRSAAMPILMGEGKNNVILYKGTAIGMLSNPSLSVNVTGSIQYNSGQFVITGNGTITITA